MELKRGDVVLVKLTGKGSVQCGDRPCIVTSNDLCNKFSPVVSVVPLTSKVFKKEMVTHLKICKSQYPIHTDSVALCEQIGTIDKSQIIGDVLFRLNQLEMKKLDRCMAIQLGIEMPVAAQQRKAI